MLGVAWEQAKTLPKITAPHVLFLDAVGGSVWTLSKIPAPLGLFLDVVGGSVWTLPIILYFLYICSIFTRGCYFPTRVDALERYRRGLQDGISSFSEKNPKGAENPWTLFWNPLQIFFG